VRRVVFFFFCYSARDVQFVKARRYILLFFVFLSSRERERERERAFFSSSMKKNRFSLSLLILFLFRGPLVVMHQLSVVAGWCNASLDSERGRGATSPALAS
jgi:hypothetical protein